MATVANLQIHLTTVGDVVLDQVYNLKENPNSIAVVFVQQVGDVETVIFNPFPAAGFILGGLLVVPPKDNIHPWSMTAGAVPGSVRYHPASPCWFALKDVPTLPKIQHYGPVGLLIPFTLIWI